MLQIIATTRGLQRRCPTYRWILSSWSRINYSWITRISLPRTIHENETSWLDHGEITEEASTRRIPWRDTNWEMSSKDLSKCCGLDVWMKIVADVRWTRRFQSTAASGRYTLWAKLLWKSNRSWATSWGIVTEDQNLGERRWHGRWENFDK